MADVHCKTDMQKKKKVTKFSNLLLNITCVKWILFTFTYTYHVSFWIRADSPTNSLYGPYHAEKQKIHLEIDV